jgi:DNA-binding IclR family transcriptional regulator
MVERITLIMDLFESPQAMLSLEDVAYRTGLPRSTAHRILDQLVRMRWLDHMSTGYRLGRRALGLGGRETGHGVLRAAAAPVLHELALRTGLVVHLAVLDETEVYYLDKIGGRSAVAVPSRVGGRAPAHCTALGKAMLASLTPERIDEEYAGSLVCRTPRTIGTLDQLHQELSRIRSRHGLAFERGECFDGISCVAVALSGPDGPTGALSLVGEVRTPLERLAPVVANAARVVADELRAAPKPTRRTVQGVTAPRQSWSAESMAMILASSQGEGWW